MPFPYWALRTGLSLGRRLDGAQVDKEREMHPAITEQLTAQRIRELDGRARQLAAARAIPRHRAARRAWFRAASSVRRRQAIAVVVPLVRREA